ncbi:hypothetical protein CC86DRAFT_30523 [Ophiobolus disseminans]|uniref:Uncharacterized protein n=1 Tax=Ophiobolus disseminans TaxID=1469910 RepID=A0A6A6ZZI3_9PLEO|nr:hypothetical protein CC86DRAFT_30523 [Ophiobolus disseminans]
MCKLMTWSRIGDGSGREEPGCFFEMLSGDGSSTRTVMGRTSLVPVDFLLSNEASVFVFCVGDGGGFAGEAGGAFCSSFLLVSLDARAGREDPGLCGTLGVCGVSKKGMKSARRMRSRISCPLRWSGGGRLVFSVCLGFALNPLGSFGPLGAGT